MLSQKIPFDKIDFVLLDMDGTLLDKHFDDYFWECLVPEKYAERNKISFETAQSELYKKYKDHERTLNWTDIDFWSQELKLDIPALKEQIRHLIEIHPHVDDFLRMLKKHKKKIFLVTNAHFKSLNIKFKKTDIGKYFDVVITSSEIGYPKELLEFWEKAQDRLKFNKERTLFVDDTEAVLVTARNYGIKYIVHKARPSSRSKPKISGKFLYIHDFDELIY